MEHTFFCDNCGKRFDVDAALAGKRARCKDCHHEFVIPGLAPAAVAKPDPPRPNAGSRAPQPYDPYPLEDLPANPPRLGKPVDEFTHRRRRSEPNFGWAVPLTIVGLVLEFVLFSTAFYLLKRENPFPCVMAIGWFMIGYYALLLFGLLLCYIVAFSEDSLQGCLCLFCPPYLFYYLATRWDAMWRPSFMMLSGVGLLIVGTISTPLFLPAMMAMQKMALEVQKTGRLPDMFAPQAAQEVAPTGDSVAPQAAEDQNTALVEPPRNDAAGERPATDPENALARAPRDPAAEAALQATREGLMARPAGRHQPDEDRGPIPAAPRIGPVFRKPAAPTVAEPLAGPPARIAELLGTPQNGRAIEALTTMGSSAEEAVIPHLRSDNWFARKDACRVLKVIGTEKSVSELRVIAGNHGPSAGVAREALIEIARRRGAPDP